MLDLRRATVPAQPPPLADDYNRFGPATASADPLFSAILTLRRRRRIPPKQTQAVVRSVTDAGSGTAEEVLVSALPISTLPLSP
jgi:hypothetical protein